MCQIGDNKELIPVIIAGSASEAPLFGSHLDNKGGQMWFKAQIFSQISREAVFMDARGGKIGIYNTNALDNKDRILITLLYRQEKLSFNNEYGMQRTNINANMFNFDAD